MPEDKKSAKYRVGWRLFTGLSVLAVVVGALMITLGWQSAQRKIVKPPPTITPGTVVVSGTSMGSPSAPITIVEYSDFQCHFCQDFTFNVAPFIESEYIATGKVRLVFKHVIEFGPESQLAAEAAESAAEQNQFWPFYHNLMLLQLSGDQADLEITQLQEIGRQIGLNMVQFDESLSSGKFAAKVRQDDAEGRSQGLTSIPGFFVNGVKADARVAGSIEEFRKVLDAELVRLGK